MVLRNLECSSVGDKRFSAFYAHTSFFGKVDSIENIYQSVKRDMNGNKCGKGKKVDHIIINGKRLSPSYLTPFYIMLWVKYLDNNKELVTYADKFDTFTDKFRGKCINCQADIIKAYVKNGRSSLMCREDVKDLCSILRG